MRFGGPESLHLSFSNTTPFELDYELIDKDLKSFTFHFRGSFVLAAPLLTI